MRHRQTRCLLLVDLGAIRSHFKSSNVGVVPGTRRYTEAVIHGDTNWKLVAVRKHCKHREVLYAIRIIQ